jgi:predicted acyl esterase
MVQIQSSCFPLTDRNPQVFLNIPDAKPSDFVRATQHVYRGQGQASGIETNVLLPAAAASEKK